MGQNIKITEMAHALVRRVAGPGATVVDATVGNGHDTLFLAGLVGPAGRVIGFDVQSAVAANAAGVAECENVELHRCGHERMREFIDGPVRAAMFNLGYLPGGDKSVTTRPETTVAALRQAAGLLEPGGIITVLVYTGHEGGIEEGEAVLAFCRTLPGGEFEVARHESAGGGPGAPFLVEINRSTVDGPRSMA